MISKYKNTKDGKIYFQYQLSYTDKFGKRHQPRVRKTKKGKRISTRKEAERLELDHLIELKNKVDGNYSSLKFSDWHKRFLEQYKYEYRKSTISMYDGDLKKWLSPRLNQMKLGEIKKSDIQEFVLEYIPSLDGTVHTQKRILRNLRRVLESAKEEGYVPINPASSIKVKTPPAKKEVLNPVEVEKLLLEAKTSNHFFYHLWAVALLTGMRSGELYALRWSDIDMETRRIHISKQWTNKDGYHATKNNRNRIVPISDDLHRLLLELKNIGPFKESLKGLNGSIEHFEDLVLPRNNKWKFNTQAQVTRDFCKAVGITQVKFHDLRATFITSLLAQGVSYPKVMSIVGHCKTSTLDEYLRLAGVNVEGSTNRIGYSLPRQSSENRGFNTSVLHL